MQYPTISEYVKASQDASDNLDMSTEATDEELNEAITDEFGVKYSKDGRKLLKAPQELDRTYSIRKGTKIVCDMAFAYCKSLSNVVIPDSVTSIGGGAFNECDSLRSVVIPDGVTSIGERAFAFSSLSTLVIPDGVNSIDNSAFWGCSSLSSLVIPDGVTSIGDGAFWGCTSLSSLVIPDGVTSIGDYAFGECNFPYNLRQELISRFGRNFFW